MEGYLKKWANIFSRYKLKYFVLKDGILEYYREKEGKLRGKIHMEICEISLSHDDPLKIILNSGTKLLILHAEKISDKIQWLTALKEAKEKFNSEYLKKEVKQYDTVKNFFLKNRNKESLLGNDKKKKVEDLGFIMKKKIDEIWEFQIKFDENLNKLCKTNNLQPEMMELVDNLDKFGTGLIVKYNF